MTENAPPRRRLHRARPVAVVVVAASSAWLLATRDGGGSAPSAAAAAAVEVSADPARDLAEGRRLREVGRAPEALPLLERAAAALPGDPAAGHELALALIEAGDEDDLERAEELSRAATEREPENAEYVFGLAQVVGTRAAISKNPLVQLSRGTESKRLMDRAVELDGTLVDARLARMLFYVLAPSFLGGGLERARAEAAELAEIDAVAGLFAEGWIAEEDEDFERAEALHAEALALDPTYTHAHFRLGYLLLGQDRFDEARAHFEACGEHAPYDPRSYQGLARCRLGSGDVEGALRLHERALELAPDFSASIFGMGECYAERGDDALAREHFERYLVMRDEGEAAEEARAWLDAHAE